MDFLGNIGQSLQKGGIKAAIQMLGSQFGLPASITDAVSNVVDRLDGNQLDSLTDGLKNLGSGDYQQALGQFSSLAQQLPTEGILHWFKGALELKDGQAAQAQQDLMKAQELDSQLPDFSALLGLLK